MSQLILILGRYDYLEGSSASAPAESVYQLYDSESIALTDSDGELLLDSEG